MVKEVVAQPTKNLSATGQPSTNHMVYARLVVWVEGQIWV